MGRRRTGITIFCCLVLVACAVALLCCAEQDVTSSAGRTITLSAVPTSAFWLLVGGDFVAFVAGISMLIRRHWVGALPLAIAVISPFYFFTLVIQEARAHQIDDTWTDREGSEYAILTTSFLQGREIVLAKSVDNSHREFQVLADSTWEEEYGVLLPVRPVGFNDDGLKIIKKDSLLLAVGGAVFGWLTTHRMVNRTAISWIRVVACKTYRPFC